jgi:putative peptidoglycan lipid II flippase
MFWWAFSLPFQGVSLLFSRTFFSLQRPWVTTALAGGNLAVNAAVAAALYSPFGVGGIVVGTVVATMAMTIAQGLLLRPELGGVEGRRSLENVIRMAAAAAALGAVSYGVWWVIDQELGRALWAQIVSVGTAITAGLVVYAAGVWLLKVPEAQQIKELVIDRVRRRAPKNPASDD